ncbi:MAG: fasciclin domain-containing protein [Bacteroidaceae bacterium]|nr:fasciclin domain-containing protein [Bacteroidaceae bacterium]
MKLIKNIKNYCGVALLIGAAATVTLNSCSENIDESDLYTFTGEMMIDHFENNPETFSSYLTILGKVHPSKRSTSTMKELLAARGHYTCFAPTNEAIQMYLDSLYSIGQLESNQLEQISDSVAEALVFNSIVQNGDNEAYATTDFEEGALGTTNMNDRYIDISYSNDSLNNTIIYVNVHSRIIDGDIEVENGFIHTIDKVLSPSNVSVADLVINAENTTFFGSLLQMTGWDVKLQAYKDEVWEEKYDDVRGTQYTHGSWTGMFPNHRYIGYTIFVEPDSVYAANGINSVEDLKEWLQNHAYYNDDTSGHTEPSYGDDYDSEDNAINQFVSYHLLPERLTFDKLVTFANEYGCSAGTMKNRTATQFYVNVWEYWETMGKQRRSVKVTGLRGEKRLNRVSVYNLTTYRERSSEITIPGIKINSNNGSYNNQALNGYYYPIDDILVWNSDVPTKVLNERMRYDVTSLFPEMLTNGIRQNRNTDECAQGYWYLMNDKVESYIDNVVAVSKETQFIYLPNQGYSGGSNSWMNYQIDEFNIQGIFDFTMKLPPVPYTGTYELRYGINANDNRGMAQVYLGTNKDNLPAIGIPLDLRSSSGTNPTATGWVSDTSLGDEEAINENDKAMRNLGFMKGPKYVQLASSTNRDEQNALRKIIYTGQFEAGKTYYIRFKSVLSGTTYEFFYDYLELVPKSVYAGDEAEDKW